jgi:hypothetical protein
MFRIGTYIVLSALFIYTGFFITHIFNTGEISSSRHLVLFHTKPATLAMWVLIIAASRILTLTSNKMILL